MPGLFSNPMVPAGIIQGMHNVQDRRRDQELDQMRMGEHPVQQAVRLRQADAWLRSHYATDMSPEDREAFHGMMAEGVLDPANVIKSQDNERLFMAKEEEKRKTSLAAGQQRLDLAQQKQQMTEDAAARKAKGNVAILSTIPGLSKAKTWPQVQAILMGGGTVKQALEYAHAQAKQQNEGMKAQAEASKRDQVLQSAIALFSGRKMPPDVQAATELYKAGGATDAQLSGTVIRSQAPQDGGQGQGGGRAGTPGTPGSGPVGPGGGGRRSWKLSAADQTADTVLSQYPAETISKIFEPLRNPGGVDPTSEDGARSMQAAATLAGYIGKVSVDPMLTYSEGMAMNDRLIGAPPRVTIALRSRLIEWENNAWSMLSRLDKNLPDNLYGAALMELAAGLKMQPEELIKAAQVGRQRWEQDQTRQ